MAASDEQLALDGLDLNIGGGNIEAEVMQFTPAKKRYEWQDATDDDGSLLIRNPKHDNSRWDLVLNVHGTNRDAAQDNVGLITAKLEEASRSGPLGIPMVWTPANSSDSRTFYVLSGEITEIPISHETGYFSSAPNIKVSVTLYCRPFNYGAEITSGTSGFTTTASTPLVILSCAGALGDVPAEARLVVTDAATQSRDYVAWGREWRHQAGADLELRQNELTNSGFAGTSTTRGSSVSTNVYRGDLTTTPIAVCGTGNQPHIGTFRVMARVLNLGATEDLAVTCRLAWRHGDGPFTGNPWYTCRTEGGWQEADLGLITIPPKLLGTQRWQGQIEAYTTSTGAGGQVIDIDYLLLIPAGEGYGKARTFTVLQVPTTFSARDEFSQSAGALIGKTLPAGGTWAGAGDADDFTVETTGHTAQRTAVTDGPGHFAQAGTTNFTNVITQVEAKTNTHLSGVRSVVARFVDINNYIMAGSWVDTADVTNNTQSFRCSVKLAGAWTHYGTTYVPANTGTYFKFRLHVTANGFFYAWWGTVDTVFGPTPNVSGYNANLATGGTLATGKVGFYDERAGGEAATRNFDNFYAAVPADDSVVFSSQSIEFRSDETQREDSTGTYWGPPQTYRGAPFYLPPAGDENRTSRIAVMARRVDADNGTSNNVTDSTTVAVNYTPRYLYLPR